MKKYFTINAVLLSTIIGYNTYFANMIDNIIKLMFEYKLSISIRINPCDLIILLYGKENYLFYDITWDDEASSQNFIFL